MLPYSHSLWTARVARHRDRRGVARALLVRGEARKKPGTMPPGALRLAEVIAKLHALRAVVHDGRREYERRLATTAMRLEPSPTCAHEQPQDRGLRAHVADRAAALRIGGIAGYRNDTNVSLGRQLRDAYGAALMISNDRIYGTNAPLLLMARED